MDFPARPEDLDAAWLTEALVASGAVRPDTVVSEFVFAPIGAGFGQTGDAGRITIDYRDDAPGAPRSAFIKFSTQDPRRRAASQRLGLYQREVDFYTRLAPRTTVAAPRCYFAQASADGSSATLLLEDFPEHRAGDDIVGLKLAEAKQVVDLLVALHAPFWGKSKSIDLAPLDMGARDTFEPAWDEMARSFGEYLPPAFHAARDRFLGAIDGLQQWVLSEPATIGHGDLKLDNILFAPGDTAAIVAVDWQAIRPQRGIRDLGYALSHSMEVADRRAGERALLARYCDGLAAHGIAYPLAEAERDYPVAMLFDFLTVIYIIGVNLNTNERAIRRKHKLLERTTAALTDWDALSLLDQYVG